MASDSSSSKPRKGILKSSSSIDHSFEESEDKSKKDKIEWDEMNILATLHPADKDYGFMKVDEPPTPYNRSAVSDGEDEEGRKVSADDVLGVDPDDLASRLKSGDDLEKKFVDGDGEDDDSEDDSTLTEEERVHKKVFLKKRKMHYNEFQAVQLAKKLMAQDKDDDDEDGEEASTSAGAMSGVCSDQCSSSPNRNENNDNEEESIECSSSSNQDGGGDGGD